MKQTNGVVWALALGVVVVLAGCGKKEDSASSDQGSSSATAPPTVTAPAQPTAVATPNPTTVATAPVNHDADANAVRSCCSSLRSEAGKKTGAEKGKYETAATTCDGLVEVVRRGAGTRSSAMGSIRASLRGAAPPGGCQLLPLASERVRGRRAES